MTIPLGCASLRTSARPTRTTMRKRIFRHNPNGRPYLVLLQVGFTLPPLLPAARCALTAPFHPYQQKLAVCFLWHFPWGRPRRTLSGTLLPWSPDFPPFVCTKRGHPAIWRGPTMGRGLGKVKVEPYPRAAAKDTATAAIRVAVSLSSTPSTLLWRKRPWNEAMTSVTAESALRTSLPSSGVSGTA